MNLKDKIIKSGLKAADISRESGVDKGTISRILSGETYAPKRSTTEKIEAVINIVSKQVNN